jgi:hypothetical protein
MEGDLFRLQTYGSVKLTIHLHLVPGLITPASFATRPSILTINLYLVPDIRVIMPAASPYIFLETYLDTQGILPVHETKDERLNYCQLNVQ